jgi:hypothetical protein
LPRGSRLCRRSFCKTCKMPPRGACDHPFYETTEARNEQQASGLLTGLQIFVGKMLQSSVQTLIKSKQFQVLLLSLTLWQGSTISTRPTVISHINVIIWVRVIERMSWINTKIS